MPTIEDILLLQAEQNNGRGVSCVRSLCIYAQRGDMVSAETVFFTEHDKIDQYPKLEQMIADFLGLKRGGHWGFWQRKHTLVDFDLNNVIAALQIRLGLPLRYISELSNDRRKHYDVMAPCGPILELVLESSNGWHVTAIGNKAVAKELNEQIQRIFDTEDGENDGK